MYRSVVVLVALALIVILPSRFLDAQQRDAEPFAADGIPAVSLPNPPVEYRTAEGQGIRVSVVTTGLAYPWGLAFLPDGRVLVTERLGALRVIRDGALDPSPLSGVPDVFTGTALAGLMDVAVHPEFSDNRWVYPTYSKPTAAGSTVALARGRLEGHGLSDVRDIFVSDADGAAAAASRLLFAPDGTLYMTLGGRSVVGGLTPRSPGATWARCCACVTTAPCPRTTRSSAGPGTGPWFLAGASQPDGGGHPPGHRSALDQRTRADGRRRGQHHPARAQLRLACRLVLPGVHRTAGVGPTVA